jgi:kumamolisin
MVIYKVKQSGRTPTRDTVTRYGFDQVSLPRELSDVVTAVIGLDNRAVGRPASGSGAPPPRPLCRYQRLHLPTTTFPILGQLIRSLESTPGKSPMYAAAQAGTPYGASYLPSDIDMYFSQMPMGSPYSKAPKKINDISLTVNNNTYQNNTSWVQETNESMEGYDFILEITTDICTSATVAQGVTINVYFTEDSEAGWLVFLGRILQPVRANLPWCPLHGLFQPTIVPLTMTPICSRRSP